MSVRAEDGTELKAKEGIVLDRDGHPLAGPRGTVRTYTFSGQLPAIIGAAIVLPLALAAGAALFGVILAVLGVFLLLSAFFRLFR